MKEIKRVPVFLKHSVYKLSFGYHSTADKSVVGFWLH